MVNRKLSPIYARGGKNRYTLKMRLGGSVEFSKKPKQQPACMLAVLHGCRVAVLQICSGVKYCRCLFADIKVVRVVSSGAMAL